MLNNHVNLKYRQIINFISLGYRQSSLKKEEIINLVKDYRSGKSDLTEEAEISIIEHYSKCLAMAF